MILNALSETWSLMKGCYQTGREHGASRLEAAFWSPFVAMIVLLASYPQLPEDREVHQ